MKRKKKEKEIFKEDDSVELIDIESLTEIQGGIEDGPTDVPTGTCGLGCFQGAGGTDEPTG